MTSRTAIDAAKQRLNIPTLWRLLKLPGKPNRTCRSPFRRDKHPSFSIFDQGRAAKDHATGQDYDGPSFLAAALGIPIAEALKEFVAMAGEEVRDQVSLRERIHAERSPEPAHQKPDLSKFRIPAKAELRAIARDRGLALAAPEIAKRLGCLKVGEVCGLPSWILTDPAGRNAEARRLGRLNYPAFEQLSERKVHTIRHSTKSWPVGLGIDRSLVEKSTLVVIVEGSADYLAAWHFIYRGKRWDVLPIAILGRAIHGLHPDALVLLKGKQVKFFPHVDPDEGALKQIELIGVQLRKVGCQLTYFDLAGLRTGDGKPAKDLNDLAQLGSNQLSELHDLFL
jgi:hypothetical protein